MTGYIDSRIKRDGMLAIAEISCNHCNSEIILDETVSAILNCGVTSIVKLQSSTPDCLTRDFSGEEFHVNAPGTPWHGKHLYSLYRETCTPTCWPIKKIKQHGREAVFSTPFSPSMVDLLEREASPLMYKVSSIDWNYFELIRSCIETGKDVLISLTDPIKQLPFLHKRFGHSFIPMYCISRYPSDMNDVEGRQLRYLRGNYDLFGFSDHSLGEACAMYAFASGARILEKHVKKDHFVASEDAHFSSTPEEFRSVVEACQKIVSAETRISPSDSTIHVGRSLYFDRDLDAGAILTRSDVAVIRPGGKLTPSKLDDIIGSVLKVNVVRGEAVSLDMMTEIPCERYTG